MQGTQPFDPKPASETRRLAFDFDLQAGETITVADCTAAVWSGVDATPSAIMGAVSASGSQILAFVDGGVEGVVYLLTASATTSLGQTLVRQGFLAIRGAA